MSTTTLTEEQRFASALLNNVALHQSTTYISPVSQKTLEVSFSTTTNFKDEDAGNFPTILYLGPMMCSRYFLSYADALARSKRVRVIFIDRPGFGKSTPVPVEERLQHVMACIPSVLGYLDVNSISLMSASAGTLYLLNFLITPSLRAYLHPRRPYVAALVPWVHPDFSNSTLWATAARLPAAVIGSCGSLQRFVGTRIMPGIGWSSAIFGSIGATFGKEDVGNDDQDLESKSGMTKKQIDALNEILLQRMLEEDTSGFGHEALTCLRKNLPPSSWGVATSYPDFVATLTAQEAERMSESLSSNPTSPAQATEELFKMRFRVFFASSDLLIGEAGRKYFDNCFESFTALNTSIHYSSEIIENSNHDSVMDVRAGAVASVFDDVVELWKDG